MADIGLLPSATVRLPKPVTMTAKENPGTMSCTPLVIVTSWAVNRRDVPNTWPRPPQRVRAHASVASEGGTRELWDFRGAQITLLEMSPSSRGPPQDCCYRPGGRTDGPVLRQDGVCIVVDEGETQHDGERQLKECKEERVHDPRVLS